MDTTSCPASCPRPSPRQVVRCTLISIDPILLFYCLFHKRELCMPPQSAISLDARSLAPPTHLSGSYGVHSQRVALVPLSSQQALGLLPSSFLDVTVSSLFPLPCLAVDGKDVLHDHRRRFGAVNKLYAFRAMSPTPRSKLPPRVRTLPEHGLT